MSEIISVKERLPDVECGSFLVYAPKSFPKNSRWLVAEFKDDVKGFYSESDEYFMEDVTHWCELPDEPHILLVADVDNSVICSTKWQSIEMIEKKF